MAAAGIYSSFPWLEVVKIASIGYLTYWFAIAIYRVYFHPLARFPGPKLAALSFWYEFWYDVYPHRYQYLWKIKQLHEEYGPIVRINPLQLHIHDHDYYDTIYASGVAHRRDRCKWSHHSGSAALGGSMLEAMDHDLHRLRRGATANFFSKRSIQALESLVFQKVEHLLQRFREESGESIVNLNNAFAAVTMDVISEYCFGDDMGSLKRAEYGKEWLDLLHSGIQMRPLARQFPRLINMLLDIPPHIMAKFDENMARMNTWTRQMLPQIEAILRGEKTSKSEYRTVFHEIIEGDLPAGEKEPMRLMAECHVLFGAGTETTARTLAVTFYYLMKHHDIAARLRKELTSVLQTTKSTATLPQLERLPYLTAVINEGLRVAHGVSSRQPRIATGEDLVYNEWIIPRGTPVMESSYLLHTDPKVFAAPFEFQPQRWIDNPELKKYLFAFGRGSRNCLGMNLAISELYITIALLWRRFDLFIGMTDLKSEGIKAKILGETRE